jgi:uncharacterized coiled-coil DUF342 family protein
MSDEVTRQPAEISADRNVDRQQYDWMVKNRDEWKQDRDEWKQCADTLEGAVQRMTEEIQRLTAERDAANLAAEISFRNLQVVVKERDAARAEVAIVTTERDAAERERTESRAEVVQLRAERDAALTDKHCLWEELERIRAEAEGLRADLMAHPPELHQELAAERQRHVELMEDYDRQNVMIGILEGAVKRAENAMKTAQAKHVNPRIPGYAATIAQLASQIEDLLS